MVGRVGRRRILVPVLPDFPVAFLLLSFPLSSIAYTLSINLKDATDGRNVIGATWQVVGQDVKREKNFVDTYMCVCVCVCV